MLARWLDQFLELTIAIGWTVRMAVAIKSRREVIHVR